MYHFLFLKQCHFSKTRFYDLHLHVIGTLISMTREALLKTYTVFVALDILNNINKASISEMFR